MHAVAGGAGGPARVHDIVAHAAERQQEEQPEKPLFPASFPLIDEGGQYQGGVFFQIGGQSVPIAAICSQRVFIGSPPEEIINIVAVYV